MNILIRADSSSTIGTGHIMRDLVLAEQYENANIIFAAQDLSGNINHKIEEKNYRLEILNANNIDELDQLIKKLSIDMLLIDHYGIDYNFEKQLKVQNPELKILSFDDTYEKHYCDILLNHNISADPAKYFGLVPDSCEIKCGVKYTLLREEFRTISKKQRDISEKEVLTVFIAMGGADHSNKNIEILKVVDGFTNINTNVVTTKANKYLNELIEHSKDNDRVSVHVNTNQIASLMNESDFAIVTPSVTVNEVLFMGLPFIAIQTADNQQEIAKYLKDNNFQVLESYNSNDLKNAIEETLDIKCYEDTLIKINNIVNDRIAK